MPSDRAVSWDGFYNARDLGGLPTVDGRTTVPGRLFRGADPRFVSAAGWRAAHDAGVRTVLDLRDDDEVAGVHRPDGMRWTHVELDGAYDTELWRYLHERRLDGTPLYYRPFLDRRPDRPAAVLTAIARAAPGGVLYHCAAGRDRTGLVTLLLLALAGVTPDAIAADYALSARALVPLLERMGTAGDLGEVERLYEHHGTTPERAVHDALTGLDAAAYLRAAGVADADLTALRARLLEENP